LWALRVPNLQPDQAEIAKAWLKRVSDELKAVESGESAYGKQYMLTLKEDETIDWAIDAKWGELMDIGKKVLDVNGSIIRSSL